MSRKSLLALTVAAVVALVLALSAGVVITAPDTALPWSIFGASGNSSSSTNFELGSTSGQTSPIGLSTGTNANLSAGFWAGIACPNDNDGLTTNEEAGFGTDRCVADTDLDGCLDGAEVQTAPGSETTGGLRDPLNEWDYFDVNGDKHIDVPNDLLPVILAYQQGPLDAGGPGPNYTTAKDRGPAKAGAQFAWQRTGPDGHIDVPNDLLPIILQYLHTCK